MEALLIQLAVALVTHAPELIREIQSIFESSTMTEEQKQEAYKQLKVKLLATMAKVQGATL